MIFGSIFGTLYFEVLKFFKCLLGAFLSLLWSSWEPPRLEKHDFCIGKSHFCWMQFSVSWSSWCPSWVHLGAAWPVFTPKWFPKWARSRTKSQKIKCPEHVTIVDPIFNNGCTTFGVHSRAKNSTMQISSYNFPMLTFCFVMFWNKKNENWAKFEIGFGSPIGSKTNKMAQNQARWVQDGSRVPRLGSK